MPGVQRLELTQKDLDPVMRQTYEKRGKRPFQATLHLQDFKNPLKLWTETETK